MKINLKDPIMDIDGISKIPDISKGDLTIGIAIARILSSDVDTPDSLRSYVMAIEYFKEKEIEVNESDSLFIQDAIRKNKNFFPSVRGQLLQILTNK